MRLTQGAFSYLSMHRFQLIRASAIVLTFGAVIALVTGDWWVLPLAAGLHALGTMTVTYAPTVRFYELPSWRVFTLSGVSFLYLLMTWSSAWRYWHGQRSEWKGRIYR